MSISLRRPARLSLLSLAVAAACPSFAQTSSSASLDPVVVTATRTPQRLSQTVAEVRVIEREAIERLGPGGVADLLRRDAGLELSRNGGPAASTSLFLRGADSRHTVVLLDGVRIDSQATGGASWQGLPLASIERIEILSGPASALYGSDAIGGVVQLFTRQGEAGLHGDALVAAGNLGQRKAEASLRGGSPALRYSLSAAHERADGFNASTDPTGFAWSPDRDGWQRRSAHARLSADLNDAHRLDASITAARTASQFDGWDPAADDRDTQRQGSAQVQWRAQWAPSLRTEAQLGDSRDRYAIPNFGYDTDTRVRQASLLAFWTPLSGHQVQGVLERRNDRLTNADVGTDGQSARHLSSLGLGWTHTTAAHTLQLNLRQDRDSEYGSVGTGLLGGSLVLPEGWRLAGSLGTGFRAPTVYQLASAYGVRSLRPERSRNAELALRWAGEAGRASITVYRNAVKDLIGFGAAGPCASPYGCYENVSRALLRGISLKAEGTVTQGLSWQGSLDRSDPVNAATGKRLARRAAQQARLGLNWTPNEAWTWGAHVVASGERYDDAGNARRLGGYAQLDLDARWQWTKGWALEAQVANAGNRHYALARGYAVMPRSLLLGLRATW